MFNLNILKFYCHDNFADLLFTLMVYLVNKDKIKQKNIYICIQLHTSNRISINYEKKTKKKPNDYNNASES